MSRSSSRLASGRSSTPRTTLKMAALAPMPRASVTATVIQRARARAKERTAILKSRKKDIGPPTIRLQWEFTSISPGWDQRAAFQRSPKSLKRSTGSIALAHFYWTDISRKRHNRPDFNGPKTRTRNFPGHLHGFVHIGSLDQIKAAELLLGFSKRAIRYRCFSVPQSH